MTMEMDAVVSRAKHQLDVLERMNDDLRTLSQSHVSECGRVTATVDVRDGLVGLTLAPGAGGGDPQRLAELICATANAAAARVAERHRELTENLIAELSDLGLTAHRTGTGEEER